METNWFNKLPTTIIGKKILCFKEAVSTNDLAWMEISREALEGTVIFADMQLKGRDVSGANGMHLRMQAFGHQLFLDRKSR